MPQPNPRFAQGTRRLWLATSVLAAVLLIGLSVWPFLTENQIGTPEGGANPSTASDTTAGRGAPAQRAAESTVGKNNPAGLADSTGGRARAIKESSRSLELAEHQQQQLRDIIARQPDAPHLSQANFEMMIGAAVPQQVTLRDIPPEITEVLHGYWGDLYVLVQNKLVIVDQHSRRVVAIVPAVA